ncbi:pentatricopeptide repeat-containing protein At2g17525, mitochondrial [Amborella trichopoda]|uniref:Pentacotripeptide-repeat region of PRORP domain-containing protein n=1 Tax=Amborella trichopoda TaxID=13333 RepID=U5D6Y7_AMBTC|nr:pentatricopeptide repeat-containing protein At2g17525, mitochondrial [Amborella trichopoda]ERN17177.1 hypothetical protein AMTR_s00044p00145070 [Amborella trichopoda]|eukprot:XP_006855710.1 pentatricopeptide repeat-containing protein At2g17525, mitochondrial [Amborella trichopoda]
MLSSFNPAARNSRFLSHLTPLFDFLSKPISTSPPPTTEQIARLILDQKSPCDALQTFTWASKIPHFLHTNSTYRALIHKLCSFCSFPTAIKVIREIPISLKSPPSEDIFLTLIKGYGSAKTGNKAIQVLDLMTQCGIKPSLKVYNSILNVLVRENIDLARDFYRQKMMKSGIFADEYTFGILMKGLCATNRVSDGFKLLQLMKNQGVEPNPVVYNTLIHCLCKNGKVGRARSLMSEMTKPSDVTFNILISGYCRERNFLQALVLFEKSLAVGLVPDVVTVTKLIEVLCEEGRVAEAKEVLHRVEERGVLLDTVAYNALINGFCRAGELVHGESVLKGMYRKGCLPNSRTYDALISGFCSLGKFELGLNLLHEMTREKIRPEFSSFEALIRGFCRGGRMQDGLEVLGMMEDIGTSNRVVKKEKMGVYNTIIYGFYCGNRVDEAYEFLTRIRPIFTRNVDMNLRVLDLCKGSKIEEAIGVFDEMVGEGNAPCVIVYDCLIDGLCKEWSVFRAFGLMNQMVCREFFPNLKTLRSIVGGFCMEGNVKSAAKFLEEMAERGYCLDAGVYNILIDAFCENGDLVNAQGILEKMVKRNVVPDSFTWKFLLDGIGVDMVGVEIL